ncbi:MAG: hypothetical protein AB7T17_09830, partial [Geobacter sp.]
WLAVRSWFDQARGVSATVVPAVDLALLAAGAGYRVRRLIRLAAEADGCMAEEQGRCGDC